MKVLLVGATGTIGGALAQALEVRHEILRASHVRSTLTVDLANPESIQRLYQQAGRVDAVVCVAGLAAYGPLTQLSDADFALSVSNKMMGQINLVRYGVEVLADKGCFTLTTGMFGRLPAPNSSALSLVNGGIEAFVRSVALELPRGLRINAVAPGWVRETLVKLQMDPAGGVPAAELAQTYVKIVEGSMMGQTLEAAASSAA